MQEISAVVRLAMSEGRRGFWAALEVGHTEAAKRTGSLVESFLSDTAHKEVERLDILIAEAKAEIEAAGE